MKRFFTKHYVIVLLVFFSFITLLLHLYKPEIPCLNADDASFGYNAYSIVETGKDEYGKMFPARFKAFGENKLPGLPYIAAPFLKILGTQDIAIRLPLLIVGLLFPTALYFFLWELFRKKPIGLIAAFLTAVSSWVQITTRTAHEVPLSAFFILVGLTFFLAFLRTKRFSFFIWFVVLNGLSLFTYHLGKLFQPFFIFWLVYLGWTKKISPQFNWKKLLVIFLIPVLFFAYTEYANPTNRIGNLVFYKDQGFDMRVGQKIAEDNNRLMNNKAVESIHVLTKNYLSYFSPEYLAVFGDDNPRFGHEGIGPITPVEYLFIFIGLYFLFKNKEDKRYLILALLLWSPLSASLAWAGTSVTRNFFSVIPILVLVSYGFYYCMLSLKNKRLRLLAVVVLLGAFLFFRYTTWDFYFFHFPQRPLVISASECGYKDLTTYVKNNYDEFGTFYITKEWGQPYIHLLYNLQYSPAKYQSQANLSAPDKYGFGQVEKFDKFVFSLPNQFDETNVVYIGRPWEITNRSGFNPDADMSQIKKITVGKEDVFWILERD